jgi:hypothetical protein
LWVRSCTGETKQSEKRKHFLSALPCGRWIKTEWGAVQIVSTLFGKAVRTGPKIYCVVFEDDEASGLAMGSTMALDKWPLVRALLPRLRMLAH